MRDVYKGFFALLGTSLIYGSFGVLARALTPYLTANQMTFARSLIVGVILGVILLQKKIKIFDIKKKLILPLIIHSVTFGFTIFLFTYAVLLTSLSKATFSFYSTTLIASLVSSVYFFKEGLNTRKAISFTLAVIALLIFIVPTGIKSLDLGMMMTGIAGIGDVITNSMKKYLGDKIDRLVLVFYQMLTGIIFGSLLILSSKELHIIKSFDVVGIGWLLFFALNFFLLSWLASYGFQHFDLNLGTIILSMEFVFASIFGFLLYGEQMSMIQILGSAILVASIIIMNLPERRLLNKA